MADVHDKATRSKNMRAIATRDTAIEKRLASLLTGQGLAFRVQDASLPGRPDFVVDEYRCVIFTHGCFWHHHHCYLFRPPEPGNSRAGGTDQLRTAERKRKQRQ